MVCWWEKGRRGGGRVEKADEAREVEVAEQEVNWTHGVWRPGFNVRQRLESDQGARPDDSGRSVAGQEVTEGGGGE